MAMNFVTFNQDYSCLAVGENFRFRCRSPALLTLHLSRNLARIPHLPYRAVLENIQQ